MNKNIQIPNKNIRTIILIIIVAVILSSAIYVAITKENNNFDAHQTREEYEDSYYDDYDDDYEDDDYYDDYEDDYEDDYNYDDDTEQELSLKSHTVVTIYDYIKEYPYIPGLKENFTCASLTSEEKMKLVAASLHSKGKKTYQPVTDSSLLELTIENRIYKAATPNQKYAKYEVENMYTELFGTSETINTNTIMMYGYDIAYKYDETAYGYVEYTAVEKTALNTAPTTKLTKAVKKGSNLDLYISIGNQTEKYSFEETSYNMYKFTGRTTTKEKNSL